MRFDIEYDEQWFLRVDHPSSDEVDPASLEWAERAADGFNVAEGWTAPDARDDLVALVAQQSTLFTTNAAAGFLYCPRGLPATAVVEVSFAQAEGSGALAALDNVPLDETALPRQVTDVSARGLGDGVLVHGVAVAGEEGELVGIASYSFVSEGTHVLVTVTSADLEEIALGRPHFDEFVDSIRIAP